MPHKNRNWQRRWKIDFDKRTATHDDGWIFQFTPHPDGSHDGRLMKQPANITPEQIKLAPRIAREAGEAWQRACAKRK